MKKMPEIRIKQQELKQQFQIVKAAKKSLKQI